LIWID